MKAQHMWICLYHSLSFHLQDIKDCRKHGLKEVVLSCIGGKSKPLTEAGVLHVEAEGGKVKKILCHKFDQRVGNTDKILLLSLRAIRDQRRKHRRSSPQGSIAGKNLFSSSIFKRQSLREE